MKQLNLLLLLVLLFILQVLRVTGMDTTRHEYSRQIVVNKTMLRSYTMSRNYVVETIYLDPTSSGSSVRTVNNVNYLDGFGRKLQEIQVGGVPGGTGDIIQHHVYGVLGRVEREYLPYNKSGNNGAFDSGASNTLNWDVYDPAEALYAFTRTDYDNSPLDRVVKQTGPGRNWHVNQKGVTTTYGMNKANEVKLYRVSDDGALISSGFYVAGSLQKVTATDEDGKVVETYMDNVGQTVMVVNVESDDNRLETCSVYDDRGRLRYVLSPEASARVGTTASRATLEIRQFGYYYEYDNWGRLILKQLPGCDPVYMVYDNRDRLVMSQDGKQREESEKKWSYSLYDGQNRVEETGEVILVNTTSHAILQKNASTSDNYLPVGTRTALQYTAYDNYRATDHVIARPFTVTAGYATSYHSLVTGLVTSVKTKVLGEEPDRWLTTTMYYDDRCRVIQTTSDNIYGQPSRVDTKYDFVGNVVQQRESHSISTSQVDVLESVHEYDDRGRLLSSTVKLNGGSPATFSYFYDAVGRLVRRTLGGVAETLVYNPRGWLTGKESEPFKMKLRYESPEGGLRACWNGNISEWEWQHGTNKALMYGFAYDRVNRLTGTRQKQKNGVLWDTLPGSYLEKEISYDYNGNIKTLQRTAGGSLVDNLVYAYTGNQLTGLTEGVHTSPTGDVYSPGSVATGSYAYDKNGNMINDSRRALNLSYDLLNLLSDVKTVSGGLKARYTYLGDGTKLRVRDGGEVNGFDYLGSLTYKKSAGSLQLESANFGEGMIRVTGSNSGQCEVDYFLTDHLGSVRVIVDGGGVVKERNDYYPFGARHVQSDYPQRDGNRYKYNGKEDQVTGDLKYLDYGARMYDSGLGRWFTGDPFQESFVSLSPYNYCSGNPLVFIDPNGALMTHYVDENYNSLLHTNDGSDDVVVVPNDYLGDFKRFASFYSEPGLTPVYDSKGWNSFWKNKFGLASRQLSELELAVGDLYSSKDGKNKAIAYFLSHQGGDLLAAAWSETSYHLTNITSWVDGLSMTLGVGSVTATSKVARKSLSIAKVPVGRSEDIMGSVARNSPTIINGVKFTGHALEQMQARGIISPTAVLDVVKNPARSFPGNRPGTMVFIRDNLKIITNRAGEIVTVIWQ